MFVKQLALFFKQPRQYKIDVRFLLEFFENLLISYRRNHLLLSCYFLKALVLMKVKGQQGRLYHNPAFNHTTIYVDCEVIKDWPSVSYLVFEGHTETTNPICTSQGTATTYIAWPKPSTRSLLLCLQFTKEALKTVLKNFWRYV